MTVMTKDDSITKMVKIMRKVRKLSCKTLQSLLLLHSKLVRKCRESEKRRALYVAQSFPREWREGQNCFRIESCI